MNDDQLWELQNSFATANRRREVRRHRVIRLRKKAEAIEVKVHEREVEIDRLQAMCDQQHAHAERAFLANHREKGYRKIARRDEYGAAAKQARQERDQLAGQADALRREAEGLWRLLEIPRFHEEYVVARHHWLEALSVRIMASDEARDDLWRLAVRAGIPDDYLTDLSQIWVYCQMVEDDEVQEAHLFYGGADAPTGEGVSPDGAGHGYCILSNQGGNLALTYSRSPEAARPALARTRLG